jgi:excisionase family DNA binding protein
MEINKTVPMTPTRSHPTRGFATVEEAAAFLGLSKAMVYKQIHQQLIPSVPFGRAVRIPWSWLLERAESWK